MQYKNAVLKLLAVSILTLSGVLVITTKATASDEENSFQFTPKLGISTLSDVLSHYPNPSIRVDEDNQTFIIYLTKSKEAVRPIFWKNESANAIEFMFDSHEKLVGINLTKVKQ